MNTALFAVTVGVFKKNPVTVSFFSEIEIVKNAQLDQKEGYDNERPDDA